MNPRVPLWAPLALVPFLLFNLFLAAGLRDLFVRLFARKRFREWFVFGVVMAAALPQLLVLGLGNHFEKLWGFSLKLPRIPWPWTVMGELAAGSFTTSNLVLTLGWVVGIYRFGRAQFERSLSFDASAVRAADSSRPSRWSGVFERLYRLPAAFLPDPLGVLVEKEIRYLSRAPRFRLLFLMGFTFGIVILLPLAFGRHGPGILSRNYLTAVCAYSVVLLGEVTFWNTFGFDRSAAQFYFVSPVPLSKVLVGKNLAAAFFVALELILVITVCAVVRVPLSLPKIIEAMSVAVMITLYALAVGNLSSTSHPRGVDPADSWRRSGAGKFQLTLLLIYPIISIPAGLAYLARYAFASEAAFYAVLAFSTVVGAILYWVALDTAVQTADRKRDKLLQALTEGHGMVD